jgi:predicted  nucleic acid-binding Zn-ribbon protein
VEAVSIVCRPLRYHPLLTPITLSTDTSEAMHPDVQSLLAVQQDDLEIYELESRLESLAPRLGVLEKERARAAQELERASAAVAVEEARHRDAMHRVDSNRQLVERSQRAYESVTTPREANAAMVQLEQTKRMVDDSERDAAQINGRIVEMRRHVGDLQTALADVEHRQSDARTALETERTEIERHIAQARAKRDATAKSVPRAMLAKYDKVRTRRRAETVFPLRGPSCSACDTAIPTQRRAAMAATGALEMCEGCGALLYAGE